MRAARAWLKRRLWDFLPEPRIIHAVMLSAWLTVATIGAVTIATPPRSISSELGPLMSLIWGCLLALGGVLGTLGIVSRFWWLERAGIWSAIAGMSIYLATVTHLQFAEGGSRLTQMGFILLAIIFLLTRLLRIWGLHSDPRLWR